MSILNFFKHPTPEEIERREIQREVEIDIRLKKRMIANVLAGFGFCEKTSYGRRLIQFDRADLVTGGGLILRVDLRPWKWFTGKAADDLSDPRIINHLSLCLGREVEVTKRYAPGGIWIYVHGLKPHEPGTPEEGAQVPYSHEQMVNRQKNRWDGLPIHVRFEDRYAAVKDSMRHPRDIYLGETAIGPIFGNIEADTSWLITGSIGTGKTNLLRVISAQLMLQNDPEHLQLAIVDPFSEISIPLDSPYLLNWYGDKLENGMVTSEEKILGMFTWLEKEAQIRRELLYQTKTRSLHRYNKQATDAEKRPLIVLLMDGLFNLGGDGYPQTHNFIKDFALSYRFCGILPIITTHSSDLGKLRRWVGRNLDLSTSHVGRCEMSGPLVQTFQSPYIPIDRYEALTSSKQEG